MLLHGILPQFGLVLACCFEMQLPGKPDRSAMFIHAVVVSRPPVHVWCYFAVRECGRRGTLSDRWVFFLFPAAVS